MRPTEVNIKDHRINDIILLGLSVSVLAFKHLGDFQLMFVEKFKQLNLVDFPEPELT